MKNLFLMILMHFYGKRDRKKDKDAYRNGGWAMGETSLKNDEAGALRHRNGDTDIANEKIETPREYGDSTE